MGVANVRVLALSLGIAAALGVGAGFAYGLFSAESIPYGIATGLFVVGIGAFALGLLGATEPPEGWSTRRRRRNPGRRSTAARAAGDVGVIERVTSLGLVVWGVVVGGGLIALSFVLFAAVG